MINDSCLLSFFSFFFFFFFFKKKKIMNWSTSIEINLIDRLNLSNARENDLYGSMY
jgi:hypothetical protein